MYDSPRDTGPQLRSSWPSWRSTASSWKSRWPNLQANLDEVPSTHEKEIRLRKRQSKKRRFPAARKRLFMDAPAAPTALFRRIEASFLRQGLMQHLGARLLRVEPGLCEVALPYSERVTQQQGGFHGGAMGALADIAGGYAALTVAAEDAEVTTVEYKINFMAGFKDGELRALGRVAKAGKRIIVTTAEVTHVAPAARKAPAP
jgi:uncharacterized protein (TIGR00369 family)